MVEVLSTITLLPKHLDIFSMYSSAPVPYVHLSTFILSQRFSLFKTHRISEDALSVLLGLFSQQGEGGKQFHQYLETWSK
jgi:hypothetical protein